MTDSILLAPDALKGSLSNIDVAQSMEAGLLEAGVRATIIKRPLADGGDGTINAFRAVGGGRIISTQVRGPYDGMVVRAEWWMGDDGVAVIEMARAAGIVLSTRRDPLVATTYGVGQLIQAAVDEGAKDIWIGGGGSATVDGGKGCLEALGFEFLDSHGQILESGGGSLVQLAQIVRPSKRLPCSIRVLCDVQNPAVGPEGAPAIFGPQKGATPADIQLLDSGLRRLCTVIGDGEHTALQTRPFGGAAGALSLGLSGLLGAHLQSGFDTIYDRLGIATHLRKARLVLTAEGQIDGQTQSGKTVAGLIRRAAEFDRPVWAFAGRVTTDAENWCPSNAALIPIVDGPLSLEQACESASSLVRRAVLRASRLALMTDFLSRN